MEVGLLSGLANALTLANIGFALIGCLLGTLVGILPGLGPASAMAILLPVALYLPADGAIIIMAGHCCPVKRMLGALKCPAYKGF